MTDRPPQGAAGPTEIWKPVMAEMSFLPEDYLERRNQRRTNVISLSLFVVVMSGVIAAFLVTDKKRIEVRAQKQQIDTDFAEAAKRLQQLDQLQERKQQMMRKAKVTAVAARTSAAEHAPSRVD